MNIYNFNTKVIFLLVFSTLFFSCKEDEEIEISVTSNDFSATIDENPKNSQIIGIIEGSTNSGNVTFSFESQSSNGAFSINNKTGELSVADSTLFDYETNQQLTAVVLVNNITVSSKSLINVALNDIETIISAEDVTIAISENPIPGITLNTIAAEAFEATLKSQT